MFKGIPANVFIFGWISFLTDTANDIIYPLMPVFLTEELGANKEFLGFIEGCAQTTFALATLFVGMWADRIHNRARVIQLGYTISCVSKPLVAAAWSPWAVFGLRVVDRIGKGIRTSPRDAMLSDMVSPDKRGKAYGLQRAMDNAGSVAGPLIAAGLLMFLITDLRQLFWLAAIPAGGAIVLNFWKVRDMPKHIPKKTGFVLGMPSRPLRPYLVFLFVFTLGTASDAFLILRAGELGVSTALVPVIWLVCNLIKTFTIMPIGAWSDRMDRRKSILMGRILYVCVLIAFAFATEQWQAWVLFALYGLFYGFTEGCERAILVDNSSEEHRGRNFGWYYLVIGLASLPGAFFFGFIWDHVGAQAAFLTAAGVSLISVVLLAALIHIQPNSPKSY